MACRQLPEMIYLRRLPEAVPPGYVLVHNTVRATRWFGLNGLRAWFQPSSDWLETCSCDWAAELGEDYRVRGGG